MKIEILGAKISRKFIAQIFENYPEASEGSIQCVDFDYGRKPYVEFDIFNDAGAKIKNLKIGFEDMKHGLKLFMEAKARGELGGIPWTREKGRSFTADYDRTTVDAICQFALFGKVKFE